MEKGMISYAVNSLVFMNEFQLADVLPYGQGPFLYRSQLNNQVADLARKVQEMQLWVQVHENLSKDYTSCCAEQAVVDFLRRHVIYRFRRRVLTWYKDVSPVLQNPWIEFLCFLDRCKVDLYRAYYHLFTPVKQLDQSGIEDLGQREKHFIDITTTFAENAVDSRNRREAKQLFYKACRMQIQAIKYLMHHGSLGNKNQAWLKVTWFVYDSQSQVWMIDRPKLPVVFEPIASMVLDCANTALLLEKMGQGNHDDHEVNIHELLQGLLTNAKSETTINSSYHDNLRCESPSSVVDGEDDDDELFLDFRKRCFVLDNQTLNQDHTVETELLSTARKYFDAISKCRYKYDADIIDECSIRCTSPVSEPDHRDTLESHESVQIKDLSITECIRTLIAPVQELRSSLSQKAIATLLGDFSLVSQLEVMHGIVFCYSDVVQDVLSDVSDYDMSKAISRIVDTTGLAYSDTKLCFSLEAAKQSGPESHTSAAHAAFDTLWLDMHVHYPLSLLTTNHILYMLKVCVSFFILLNLAKRCTSASSFFARKVERRSPKSVLMFQLCNIVNGIFEYSMSTVSNGLYDLSPRLGMCADIFEMQTVYSDFVHMCYERCFLQQSSHLRTALCEMLSAAIHLSSSETALSEAQVSFEGIRNRVDLLVSALGLLRSQSPVSALSNNDVSVIQLYSRLSLFR